MSTLLRIFVVLSLGLTALLVQAQGLTWTRLERQDPDDPARRGFFRAVARSGEEFLFDGRTHAWRLDAAGNLRLIVCPNVPQPPPIPELPNRESPALEAMNGALTVAGTMVTAPPDGASRIVGILQDVAGECEVVEVPTSAAGPPAAHTFVTALNDSRGTAGYSQGPDVSLGRARAQGWQRAADGTITYLGGLCNTDEGGGVTADVLYPDALANGWLTFHADCNLQSNVYRYEAGFCQDGIGCQLLRDPEGRTLWIPAVTNAGKAYAVTAAGAFVTGGKAWVVDLLTQTFTPMPLPPPSTPGGTVVTFTPEAVSDTAVLGTAQETLANCPPEGSTSAVFCLVFAQWLGVYDVPVVTPAEGPAPDQDKEGKDKHDKGRRHKGVKR